MLPAGRRVERPGPLEPGDRVEVEVEGIGVLANEVVDEDAGRQPSTR